jgi:carboxypeptidase D
MVPYDKPMEMLDMINRFVGVSNGSVKGIPSWIGSQDKEELDVENPVPSTQPAAPPPTNGSENDTEEVEDEKEDPWSEYYNW